MLSHPALNAFFFRLLQSLTVVCTRQCLEASGLQTQRCSDIEQYVMHVVTSDMSYLSVVFYEIRYPLCSVESVLDTRCSWLHAPAVLPMQKGRYPLDRRLVNTQNMRWSPIRSTQILFRCTQRSRGSQVGYHINFVNTFPIFAWNLTPITDIYNACAHLRGQVAGYSSEWKTLRIEVVEKLNYTWPAFVEVIKQRDRIQ
jgi:hypothetical protein